MRPINGRQIGNVGEAEASFKLAVWQAGKSDQAATYFKRAQELNPDDWNHHRQEWSYTPEAAGKLSLLKFQKLEEPY
jgi:hypothetical protein